MFRAGMTKIKVGVLLALVAATAFYGCALPAKSILILENGRGTGCSFTLTDWSGHDKCELQLEAGDELLIEVDCEDGEIGLTIQGEKGAEPYSGNDIDTGRFTVTVHENGNYIIGVRGKKATGNVTVEKAEPHTEQE